MGSRFSVTCFFVGREVGGQVKRDETRAVVEPVPMMTSADVAEVLRCSRHKATELLAAGDLRGRKVGNRWRVPRSEVERFCAGVAV